MPDSTDQDQQAELAYSALKRGIMEFRFAPGERLSPTACACARRDSLSLAQRVGPTSPSLTSTQLSARASCARTPSARLLWSAARAQAKKTLPRCESSSVSRSVPWRRTTSGHSSMQTTACTRNCIALREGRGHGRGSSATAGCTYKHAAWDGAQFSSSTKSWLMPSPGRIPRRHPTLRSTTST